MRSDRLVAILLMLQRREQVTAAEVAAELEISERTARRDLDALGMAGIPVYSVQGRGGGWRLLGGARIDLSGLTAQEAQALFVVAGPAAATTPEVKAALRKLVRALPEGFRDHAEAAASSLVLDSWRRGAGHVENRPPRFVDLLQNAVIQRVQVRLGYVNAAGHESKRLVHPLGIVSTGASWYLIAGTDVGQRTFRIDRVTAATATADPVVRPADFDLTDSWRQVTEDAQRWKAPVEVRGTCAKEGIDFLRTALGDNLSLGAVDAAGRVAVTIHGPSEYGLAGHLAGLVEWLDIASPPGVREHLAKIGAALGERYGSDEGVRRATPGCVARYASNASDDVFDGV
ncbi:helix-turn-helix transcriptional regulator [Microbacterium sp. ZW T5_56]|uniref:helix-turn-helix transcriptional regulator n=1 Tax=Microbacterium sp. ZW T5_56 TaxID=3378081 RepID=UPI003854BE41